MFSHIVLKITKLSQLLKKSSLCFHWPPLTLSRGTGSKSEPMPDECSKTSTSQLGQFSPDLVPPLSGESQGGGFKLKEDSVFPFSFLVFL